MKRKNHLIRRMTARIYMILVHCGYKKYRTQSREVEWSWWYEFVYFLKLFSCRTKTVYKTVFARSRLYVEAVKFKPNHSVFSLISCIRFSFFLGFLRCEEKKFVVRTATWCYRFILFYFFMFYFQVWQFIRHESTNLV